MADAPSSRVSVYTSSGPGAEPAGTGGEVAGGGDVSGSRETVAVLGGGCRRSAPSRAMSARSSGSADIGDRAGQDGVMVQVEPPRQIAPLPLGVVRHLLPFSKQAPERRDSRPEGPPTTRYQRPPLRLGAATPPPYRTAGGARLAHIYVCDREVER